MSDVIQILHLPHRQDRRQSFMEQMAEQKAKYRVWNGIVDEVLPFRGICHAHKQIVRGAKRQGLPYVIIMEDDCVFSVKGAFDYYIENMPKEFSLYLGMVYKSQLKDNRVSVGFCGLTFY